MTYTETIIKLTDAIDSLARTLKGLEEERDTWVNPARSASFRMLGTARRVVRADGTITPGLEGVQREAVRLYDAEILSVKSQIEGLRYKLVLAAKEIHNG